MDFSNETLDQIARDGGMIGFRGWNYDLVLDRLERKGFKRRGGISIPVGTGVEGSVYENESGAKVEVVTHRFSAVTLVSSVPSPKKPEPKG